MDYPCLRKSWDELLSTTSLTELSMDFVLGTIALSLLISILVAPVVLALYQRGVVKLMKVRSHTDAGQNLSPTQNLSAAEQPLRRHRDNPLHPPEKLIAAGEKRRKALQKALNWSVVVYAFLTALVLTISSAEIGKVENWSLLEWAAYVVLAQAFVACLAAPMMLLGVSNTRFKRLFWIRLAPLYVFVAVLLLLLENGSPTGKFSVIMEDFVVGIIIFAVLYIGLGERRLRNVVPLLAILMCPAIAVLFLYDGIWTIIEPCQHDEYLWSISLFFAVTIAIYMVFRYSFKLLGRLTHAYEKKRFSDAQFQVASWMIFITLIFLIAPGSEGSWNLWSFGVLGALSIGLWLYHRLIKQINPWEQPRRLLLLRVFSKDKRGEQLLDEISFHWRFIGPIYMIGGPDLAKSILEPHELFLFLRKKLRKIFISSPESLAQHTDEIDDKPDPDSRFRINEFFCFDNVWAQAVEKLLSRVESVLLDIRGFNADREGTSFEIELLARRGLLGKSVVLANSKTDWAAVNQILSRVPGAEIRSDRIWRTDQKVKGADLFKTLLNSDVTAEKG